MRIISTFLGVVLLITVAACSNEESGTSDNQEPTRVATQVPAVSATLAPGETALLGQIISVPDGSSPMSQVEVRLAKVYWSDDGAQGSYVIDGAASPTTITDENGLFLFKNLEPRDYVIVVGDLYGLHEIISNSEGAANIFTIGTDQSFDVGQIQVNLSSVLDSSPTNAYPAFDLTAEASSYP